MTSRATLREAPLPGVALLEVEPSAYKSIRGCIHPTALIDTERIGAGTRVWAFTHIGEGAVIGSNCNIGSHCYIESGVRIGDGVTIKNGNYLWDGVTICNGAFVGPQVVFTNDLRPRSPRLPEAAERYMDDSWLSPTMVGEGASIGGGAVIRPGISLKRFCMVAAGAVVTRSVRAHALVMGVPARAAGWVCCCGAKLAFDKDVHRTASCGQCSCEFEYVDGDLVVRR